MCLKRAGCVCNKPALTHVLTHTYTHREGHTHVSAVRADGVAASSGKLKRVGQKAPGFMLIFIKIILTCNVAAAASGRAGHGTSHTGAKGHSTAKVRGEGWGKG